MSMIDLTQGSEVVNHNIAELLSDIDDNNAGAYIKECLGDVIDLIEQKQSNLEFFAIVNLLNNANYVELYMRFSSDERYRGIVQFLADALITAGTHQNESISSTLSNKARAIFVVLCKKGYHVESVVSRYMQEDAHKFASEFAGLG